MKNLLIWVRWTKMRSPILHIVVHAVELLGALVLLAVKRICKILGMTSSLTNCLAACPKIWLRKNYNMSVYVEA